MLPFCCCSNPKNDTENEALRIGKAPAYEYHEEVVSATDLKKVFCGQFAMDENAEDTLNATLLCHHPKNSAVLVDGPKVEGIDAASSSGVGVAKASGPRWASADCAVIQECNFSFDAKAPEARMLSLEEYQKIYGKFLPKTTWCHNICVHNGVTGLATLLAEENGLIFTTAEAIWEFLEAGKTAHGTSCHMCVGKLTASKGSTVLTCSGGLIEHKQDNTCNEKTCLFIKSGLECPVRQMVPWVYKEAAFKADRRPESFPSTFVGF